MLSNYLSNLPLKAWKCNATKFASFYDPLPADEIEDANFPVLLHFISPSSGPLVGENKDLMPFFVPCLLKVAPLTPKMQAKTGRAEGKQRSSAHVTLAMLLVIDVDGLSQEAFAALLDKLRAVGLTFLTYSTHSHGREDKPGVRARLVIPVDRPLSGAEYKLAWHGLDQAFCGGMVAANDASGAALHQQQGVGVAHPDRKEMWFRIVHKAGVASADALIAEGRKVAPVSPARTEHVIRFTAVAGEHYQRIEDALQWLNADDTSVWFSLMMAFKAAAPLLGEDAARELAVRYSEQGRDEAKAKNDDARYDPTTFFGNAVPTMGPDIGIATILSNAKQNAFACLRQGLESGETLTDLQLQAAFYCGMHHRRAYDEMLVDFGLGGGQ